MAEEQPANDHELIRIQCPSMIWYLFVFRKKCNGDGGPQTWDPYGNARSTSSYNLFGRCTLVVALCRMMLSRQALGDEIVC